MFETALLKFGIVWQLLKLKTLLVYEGSRFVEHVDLVVSCFSLFVFVFLFNILFLYSYVLTNKDLYKVFLC